MNRDAHESAREWIRKERIEGLMPDEQAKLTDHLDSCLECAAEALEIGNAIRAFRAAPVELPPALADRTRARVYRHAAGRAARGESRWALWVAFGLSWMTGVATAPFVWRGFEWLGHHTPVPDLVLKAGFVLWWILPALAAGGILLAEKTEVFARRQ